MDQTYQEVTASSPASACSVTANSTTTTTTDALGRVATTTDPTGFWEEHYAGAGSGLGVIQKGQAGTADGYGSSEDDLFQLLDAGGAPSQSVGIEGASGAGGTQWYTDDGLGNVGAVTGTASSGGYTCVMKYDINGSPIQPTSSTNSCISGAGTGSQLTELAYQFAGRDASTGDYTFGTRQYDPGKAAFTTPDAYHPSSTSADVSIGADPLTADTYAYANSDPINLRDPDGHMIACDNGGGCGNALDYTASNGGQGGPVDQAAVSAARNEQRVIDQNQNQYYARLQAEQQFAQQLMSRVGSQDQAQYGRQALVAQAAVHQLFLGAPTGVQATLVSAAQDVYAEEADAYQAQQALEQEAAAEKARSCDNFWCGATQGLYGMLTGAASLFDPDSRGRVQPVVWR